MSEVQPGEAGIEVAVGMTVVYCAHHPAQENVYYSMNEPLGWTCNVCASQDHIKTVSMRSAPADPASALRAVLQHPEARAELKRKLTFDDCYCGSCRRVRAAVDALASGVEGERDA